MVEEIEVLAEGQRKNTSNNVIDLTKDDDSTTEDEEHGKRVAQVQEGAEKKKNKNTQAIMEGDVRVLPISVFANSIDIPFVLPARRYERGQRPWFFQGDRGQAGS